MSDLKAKYAKNILQDKICDTCDYEMFCNKRNRKLYNTCLCWHTKAWSNILKVVRLGYPNTIKNEIVSVMPMQTADDSVKYNKY